jgi:glycolate oxidase FAD binding subunit
VTTATILAPRTVEECAELVRGLAREHAVALATGGDTKRTWTRPAARVDVELSTRNLSGVVAYEPGDGVITALAGTRWRELEELVARHGHHLSPAIPAGDGATVGGVVAAGQSGMDRLHFGPLRDHVLGLRVVTADGSIAKSGGRLVKNVTGFDLHRLHTGAHGTLGFIAEASLRLHAAPTLRALGLALTATREEALRIALAAARASRCVWHASASNLADRGWTVHVLLGGADPVVESEVRALGLQIPQLPWMVARPGTRDAAQLPRTLSALEMHECIAGRWATLRVTCAPSAIESICSVFDRAAADARTSIQPGLGIVDAWIPAVEVGRIARISSELARAGARVHWRGLDDELRARVDLHGGEEPVGLALMRRIRANLDPHGSWASGRLAGGL